MLSEHQFQATPTYGPNYSRLVIGVVIVVECQELHHVPAPNMVHDYRKCATITGPW